MIKLLEHGVDPNIVVTNDGDTALMLASLRGKSLVVKALLKRRERSQRGQGITAPAEINLQNNEGTTALMLAVISGYYWIVVTLLRNEADVNLQNNKI